MDKRGFAGLLLTDLSKAFDCIEHELLIAKLHGYGVNIKSLELIHGYLYDRIQGVKINSLVIGAMQNQVQVVVNRFIWRTFIRSPVKPKHSFS